MQKKMVYFHAVDGIFFEIKKGATLGLVGESGCGKTTTARSILQLYKPTSGKVIFDHVSLIDLKGDELRKMRRRIQMIFQDPYASLNPRMTVEEIIAEPLLVHKIVDNAGIRSRVKELLELVRLNPAYIDRFPHEFSGGQRQRIGIARALALNPELIICDEPVSSLDVSIQAQIVNMLEDLQAELGLTYLFIAHDLSLVKHISDRIAVMYLGLIVEMADRDELYNHALHPYTTALLSAVPIPDPELEEKRERVILAGDVPSPAAPPSGCRFRTRCPLARDICAEKCPELREVSKGHFVACHLVKEVAPGIFKTVS